MAGARRLTLSFKRGESEDDGAYSLFELLEPPGASVDLHRHPAFQETFVVLEGRFAFDSDGKRYSLGPGETLVVPRGASHGFTCTSPESGRLLTISTPARLFEAFIADISAANLDPSADIGAVFARHGLELLRPTLTIARQRATLEKIFVAADEQGPKPSVRYVDLFGVAVSSKKPVTERVTP